MLKSDNPLTKFRIITPTLNNWFSCQHFSIYKKAVTLQQLKISSTIQNALDHCIWLSLGDSDGCVNDLGRGREWATGTASPSSRPTSCLCHFPLHSPLIILLSLANCRRSYSLVCISTSSAINKVEGKTRLLLNFLSQINFQIAIKGIFYFKALIQYLLRHFGTKYL